MKKLIWIILLTSIYCNSQTFNITGGVTDIEERLDGNTMKWNVGYSHFIESFGISSSYGKVSVLGLNYTNVNIFSLYRIGQKSYRMDLGPGVNWNDVNNQIDFSILVRNSFEIDPDLYLTFELENVFGEKNITHFSVGLSFDFDWLASLPKPRFF